MKSQAREWAQSNLLDRIKEGAPKKMVEDDLGNRFPLIPSTNLMSI